MKYLQLKNEIMGIKCFDNIEYLSKQYKKYLCPDHIMNHKDIEILERRRISGWEQFEYGQTEWSSADFKAILLTVAKDLLSDDTILLLLTDETLDEGKIIELQLNELEVLEDSYPERYQIVFMEPQDYIVFLEQGKYVIIVHHEGYVFLCVNKRFDMSRDNY